MKKCSRKVGKKLIYIGEILNDMHTTCIDGLMAKSYWLINPNRTEVKRFIKNDKSNVGVFEYMFIDTGKINNELGKE